MTGKKGRLAASLPLRNASECSGGCGLESTVMGVTMIGVAMVGLTTVGV